MKSLKYISIIGVCALPLVGCSDFLDEDNKSSGNIDGNSYIQGDPSALRATAYESLKANFLNIDMQDQATDLYTNPRQGNDGVFAQYSITADNGTVTTFYQNNGKSINYANAMVKFGEGTSVADEGRFIRALCYYYQTQQFGAVPYVTYYVESSSRDYPRTPLDELYPEVIADLEDLYANSSLPAVDSRVISKQAVAALLAKYYLAYAWDLNTTLTNAANGTYTVNSTDNFKKAAQWAEKAINGVQLTMSFADKWSPYNEGNNEVIFALQYQREGVPGDVNSSGHSLQNNYIAYYGDINQTGIKGNGSGGPNVTSAKMLKLYEEGDARFDATFMTTVYNAEKEGNTALWGTQGYYAYWNCTDAEKAAMPIAYQFFPWYTTTEQAKTWLDAHSTQTVIASGHAVTSPCAVIVDPDVVTRFSFKADGTYTQSQEPYSTYSGLNGGLLVKKFDDPASIQSVSGNDYRNVVVFHVSEMYLIAAEAYLLAGEQSNSLAKLNAVRKRSNAKELTSFAEYDNIFAYTIPSTFGEVNSLDVILDEYARELYAERTRWYELRRTRQLVRYTLAFSRDIRSTEQMSNSKGEIKWYRPIPQTEIDNNTSISIEEQNPGY